MDCQEKINYVKYLMDNSRVDLETGCLNWLKTKNPKGYGVCKHITGIRSIRCHRVMYQLCFGYISDDIQVRHSCNNASCLNPEHLSLGTNQDNVNDRALAGGYARGESHCNSKFTEEQVREIKRLCKFREMSQTKIAAKFGTKLVNIEKIAQGKLWKHIEV